MIFSLRKYLPWLALSIALIYNVNHWSAKVLPQSVGPKLAGESRAFLDFDCYWGASRLLISGDSVYGQYLATEPCSGDQLPEYVYLPTLALGLTSLGPLGSCRAEWVWFAFNTLICLGLIPLLIGALGLPRTAGMYAASVFIVLAPMATLEDLSLGQVNLQILALLLGAVWLLRLKRFPMAGLLLGLAMVIKIIPALFTLAFLRHKRAVIWPVFWGLLFVLGVFILAPGDTPATFLAALSTKATSNLGTDTNASLVGWAVRAFGPGPDGTRVLVMGNTLAVLLMAIWAWFLARKELDSQWFVAVLMALIAAVTPLYEVHHQVLLYPALLVILADALGTKNWRIQLAKLAGLLLVGILTNSRGLVPLHAAHNPMAHLLVKPAGGALWALIGWLMFQLKTSTRGQDLN